MSELNLKKNEFISIRDMIEISMLVAIGIVLDRFLKISLPNHLGGGSINFSCVPLVFISLRHGLIKGFIAGGVIFGLLSCIFDGYGFNTFPFDYLLAFGSFGIVAFGKNRKDDTRASKILQLIIIGLLILAASSLRLLFATIDSVLLYETTFREGLVYNLTYILPSFIIVTVITLILFPSFELISTYRVKKQITEEEIE